MRVAVWWMIALPAVCLPAKTAGADEPRDEARKIAEVYLDSLTGKGDPEGRELLLGGATMNAQLFSLENWRIQSRDPVRTEQGDLKAAVTVMYDLDRAGRKSLTRIVNSASSGGDLEVHQISQEEAAKILGPTLEKAQAFQKAHPVLAYVARVGKEVYWHPRNPVRALLSSTPGTGRYQLEMHLFNIVTREGPRQVPREWPLRVLRFRAGKLDTGWKILPASDWNAE